jgi:hypothetical protein
VLDENGKERHRIEGYLPKDEFAAQLLLGLARVAFMQKKWADAGKLYDEILQKYPNSEAAPEAVYWKAVSHYKGTNDHTVLGEVPKTLQQKYPDSVWAKKQFTVRLSSRVQQSWERQKQSAASHFLPVTGVAAGAPSSRGRWQQAVGGDARRAVLL